MAERNRARTSHCQFIAMCLEVLQVPSRRRLPRNDAVHPSTALNEWYVSSLFRMRYAFHVRRNRLQFAAAFVIHTASELQRRSQVQDGQNHLRSYAPDTNLADYSPKLSSWLPIWQ